MVSVANALLDGLSEESADEAALPPNEPGVRLPPRYAVKVDAPRKTRAKPKPVLAKIEAKPVLAKIDNVLDETDTDESDYDPNPG